MKVYIICWNDIDEWQDRYLSDIYEHAFTDKEKVYKKLHDPNLLDDLIDFSDGFSIEEDGPNGREYTNKDGRKIYVYVRELDILNSEGENNER